MTSSPGESQPPGPDSNGLLAPMYVPLTDVDQEVGRTLLTTLGRARIAAYLTGVPGVADEARRRLFVAADERSDARTIVASVLRSSGGAVAAAPAPEQPVRDPLDGVDTETAFAELVADWHVDTLKAVREAERQLREEDAQWRARLVQQQPAGADAGGDDLVWLDDDHYVPPPPPPLPRLSAPTIGAIALIALAIAVLAVGARLGFDSDLRFLLGIGGILAAGYILVTRLRPRTDEDEDDDGAVI
jgi:hypothetical protein